MERTRAELRPTHPDIEAWLRRMASATPVAWRRELRQMRADGKLKLPRFLYRFQSVRRTPPGDSGELPKILPHSKERLRIAIVESLLHLRSPEEFNDPFEMHADFKMGGTRVDRVARYRQLFKTQNPRGKLSEREAFVSRMLETPPETLLPGIRTSYRNACKDFGLVCFVGGDRSTPSCPSGQGADRKSCDVAARSVLMWSHYGSEHAGVCLQFDPARDVRVFHAALHLDYDDQYPMIDWVVDFHKGIGDSLLRKHTRWRYEEEHRISAPDQAGRFLPFRAEALSGIVFGCRAAPDLEQMIRGLLSERRANGLPNVRLYRAEQHSRRYDLRIAKSPA